MKQNPQPRVSSNVRRSRAASNSALITRGGPFGFARTTPAAQPAPTLATALERRGRHFQKSGGQPLVCRWIQSRFGEGAPVPRSRGATSPPIAGEGNYPGWLLVTSRFHHNKSLVRDCQGRSGPISATCALGARRVATAKRAEDTGGKT